MFQYFLACFFTIFSTITIFSQKPKVVILGVGYSTQLINYNHQPAALRAFINKVKPSAICIERSPEEYSKNDFYEFTYEQQYTVVPYAKEKNITLHPIDWLPSENDAELGFGIKELSVPRFMRQKDGFLGFTTFNEKNDFEDELYFADRKEYITKISSWYSNPMQKTSFDLPRRMFLYRTFLQSRRIQKVLENYSESDTVLIIIGSFHKNDIENNLKEQGYTIVQPSTFGNINDNEIKNQFKRQDAYAILSFNLLGMQSHNQKINNILVDYAFKHLEKENSIELEFLNVRNNVLRNKLSPKKTLALYHALLNKMGNEDWTWTGVKDKSRIDSYFDPFGNLSLKNRIRLELARTYLQLLKHRDAESQLSIIYSELTIYKKSMLAEYIKKYLK